MKQSNRFSCYINRSKRDVYEVVQSWAEPPHDGVAAAGAVAAGAAAAAVPHSS